MSLLLSVLLALSVTLPPCVVTLAPTIAQLAHKLLPTALLALFQMLILTFHAYLHALLVPSKMGLFV